MITKLAYGIKYGQLISVHDVASGLDCNCSCPKCGSKLIARKGEHKVHHFAHYHETNCDGAAETALHLAAKAILQQQKKIAVPGIQTFDNGELQYTDPEEIIFDEIIIEERISDFQPDVIAVKNGRKLFIEVAVSHFIDKVKYDKLVEYDISTLEINLEALKDGFNHDELTNMVISEITNKDWIYNVKEETAKMLYDENERKLEALEIESEELWERKVENFEILKKEGRRNGDRILTVGYFDKLYCPLIMHQKSKTFFGNEVIDLLKKGGFWNGEFYGLNSNGKWVFIAKKEVTIYPPDKFRNAQNGKKGDLYYYQLNQIRDKSYQDYKKCLDCKFFNGSNLNLEPERDEIEIICGYK